MEKKVSADSKTLSLWFWVSAWLACNINNYANFNFQEIIFQIDILLFQYYRPCSDAPAMNCHMEKKESKGRAEKQAQNGGYEKEAYLHLLSVIFEGTKVEEKHGLSELQKKKSQFISYVSI